MSAANPSSESSRVLRRLAEEKFRDAAAATPKTLSPEEMEQLIHELRVHQIELEMQNEELRSTQHNLASLKARYFDLYDLAPVGYLTIDEQGAIIEANITVTTMLGVVRKDLLERPLTQFIFPEDQDIFYLHRKNLFEEGGVQVWEMRMLLPDGSSFWAHLRATPADGEYRVTLFDISERKRIELVLISRLRISEYAFDHSLEELMTKLVDEAESLTESQIGFVHFVDTDQTTLKLYTWSSNTLSTICTAESKGAHYPLESAGVWADCIREKKPLIHNDYSSLPNRKGLPPGHAPVHRELVVPIVRNNQIVAVLGVGNKNSEYTEFDIKTIQKLTGLAWDFIALKQAENSLIQAHEELELKVSERTSELVRAHKQMKKVSFDLLWAEERERERIAGELHDRVGQSLLLAKMKLDSLADNIPSDLHDCIAEEAASLLTTTIHDIRSLTFRMRPPILDSSGIEVALEWLCSSMNSDYALQIDFTNDGQPKPLTAEVRYSLYQAVRELLLNVAKHAGTGKAALSIKTETVPPLLCRSKIMASVSAGPPQM